MYMNNDSCLIIFTRLKTQTHKTHLLKMEKEYE